MSREKGLMILLSTGYKYEHHLWAKDEKTSKDTETQLKKGNAHTFKSIGGMGGEGMDGRGEVLKSKDWFPFEKQRSFPFTA